MAQEVIAPILNEYDEVVRALQKQIDLYREEHEILRQEILKIISDNEELKSQMKTDFKNRLQTSLSRNFEPIARSEMVCNLRRQLELSLTERKQLNDIVKTSQDLISKLERQVCDNRFSNSKDLAKVTSNDLISPWEAKVDELRLELKLEKSTRDDQEAKCLKLKSEVAKLRVLLEDKEEALKEEENKKKEVKEQCFKLEQECTLVKATLKCVSKSRDALEISLSEKEKLVRHLQKRNNEASCKVEEAIEVAEKAVTERDHVLSREGHAQAEVFRLQQSLNHVIDEAARKLSEEVRKTKETGNEKVLKLTEECKRLEASLKLKSEDLEKLLLDCSKLEKAIGATTLEESYIKVMELKTALKFTEEQLEEAKMTLKKVLCENDGLRRNAEMMAESRQQCKELAVELQKQIESCQCIRLREKMKNLKTTKEKQVADLERQITTQLTLNEKWEKETENLLNTLESTMKENAQLSQKLKAKKIRLLQKNSRKGER